MSSRNATLKDFEFVIGCMKKGLISPLKYVTHRVNFDDTASRFRQLIDDKADVIKAIINF